MADEDSSYFHAIEETFIRLRGAPLLLSPADWRIARGWREKGIPLGLIRRTLEELFEKRRERGGGRRIQSLRYCARAVEEAWQTSSQLAATGHRTAPPTLDVGARLGRMADALPASYRSVATSLRGLRGEAEEVERELARIDGALMEEAAAQLTPEALKSLGREARARVGVLADRLEDAELEETVRRLRQRSLRRRLGLPVLSLFSREAGED